MRHSARSLPDDMSVAHITGAVGSNGPEFGPIAIDRGKDQSVSIHGPRENRPSAVVHFPQFLAVARVVGVETFSAHADHLLLISARNESGHAVGFSLVDWDLVEVGRALRLPGVLAGRRLEGDNILNIATVDVEH